MPNGKPRDNPVTDVVVWKRDVYGAAVDALIREIDGFTTDYGTYDPFEPVVQLFHWDEASRRGSSDVPQARFRKGFAVSAPDRNRTSARGLGNRCSIH